ncbi:hypothetical protein MMC29_005232 [Sticta canariensis]|nr:hypothetical protein [Sticta canariensis]
MREKVAKASSKYEAAIRKVDVKLSVRGGDRSGGAKEHLAEVTIFTLRNGVVRAKPALAGPISNLSRHDQWHESHTTCLPQLDMAISAAIVQPAHSLRSCLTDKYAAQVRVEDAEDNMYASIDLVCDKIARKMSKVKDHAIQASVSASFQFAGSGPNATRPGRRETSGADVAEDMAMTVYAHCNDGWSYAQLGWQHDMWLIEVWQQGGELSIKSLPSVASPAPALQLSHIDDDEDTLEDDSPYADFDSSQFGTPLADNFDAFDSARPSTAAGPPDLLRQKEFYLSPMTLTEAIFSASPCCKFVLHMAGCTSIEQLETTRAKLYAVHAA